MKDTKLPIAVWLGMLPDGIREKAIINHLLYPRVFDSDFEVECLSRALNLGFIWAETFEGYLFWKTYRNELLNQNL